MIEETEEQDRTIKQKLDDIQPDPSVQALIDAFKNFAENHTDEQIEQVLSQMDGPYLDKILVHVLTGQANNVEMYLHTLLVKGQVIEIRDALIR